MAKGATRREPSGAKGRGTKKNPPGSSRGPTISEADLANDITEDPRNANAGTERGHALIESSIARLGAGRSIVVDRHGRTIAGNKSREAMISAGLTDAIVVETDGTRPVVVKRVDLDLEDPTTAARDLAYADNRAGEVDLAWDADRLRADRADGFDLSPYFSEKELEKILENADDGIPPDEFGSVGDDVETDHRCPSCSYQWSGKCAP
jgi:hypothetical protein